MNINKVMIAGNLTRDPELKYTPSGKALSNITVAVNRKYKTNDGEPKEEVAFVRVTVWGRQAEIVNEYCTKGRPVFIEGRLRTRSWETEEGQKRSAMDVVAERVQFLGRKKEETSSTQKPSNADDNVVF